MAQPLTPDQLLSALRKWNVPLREYSGWRTRGRPQQWGPVHGVMIHHTGSDAQSDSYLRFLFEIGRPSEGIPAPLCNVAGRMNGEVWLGSAGRANDSGKGSSRTLARVIAEDHNGYDRELEPGPDDTDGNRHFYDIEVMYDGGQSMTNPQYRGAVLFACAVCDAYGWSALSVIGHREWSRRKWDPGKTDMARFRRDVRAQLTAGPPGTTPPAEEEFMGFIDNQAEFDAALDRYFLIRTDPKDGGADVHPLARNLRVLPWHQLLGRGPANMHTVMGELRLAITGTLPALIREAGGEIGLTPEQIEQMATVVASKVERVTVVVEGGQ